MEFFFLSNHSCRPFMTVLLLQFYNGLQTEPAFFFFLTNEEREKRKIDLYLKDERRLPTKNSRWPGTPKSPIKAIRLPYKDKGKVRLAPHVVDASCHSTFASKAKCAQKRKERMHNTRHSMCTIVDRRNEKERFVTLLIRIHVRPTLLRIAFSS